MSNRTVIVVGILLITGILVVDRWAATVTAKRKTERGYAPPLFLYFPDNISNDELMLLARYQVRAMGPDSGSLSRIKAGKKALLTYRTKGYWEGRPQNLRILAFCKKALQERGADMDYMDTGDLLAMYGYPREWANDREEAPIDPEVAPMLNELSARFMLHSGHGVLQIFSPELIQKIGAYGKGSAAEVLELQQKISEAKVSSLKKYMDSHPEYDAVILDWSYGGTIGKRLDDEFGRKHMGAWRVNSLDTMARGSTMPSEIWDAAQERLLDVIPWIEHVQVDDAEGTHLEFSVTPEQAATWRKGAYAPGESFLYPMQGASWLYKQYGITQPVIPDTNGVIAGTMGHQVYFPRVELKVEHGVITEVRGGGLYGDVMRELVEKYKDIQIPSFPRPGWLYLYQLSIQMTPLRGGAYFDFGFGPEVFTPDVQKYGEEHNVPITHELHINQAFTTYEATITGGHKIKLADKGNLLVDQDPEIRAIASKYGDPRDLFRPVNKRPIPGINFPGGREEYNKSPFQFHMKELKEKIDRTWPFRERGKPLQLRDLGRTDFDES